MLHCLTRVIIRYRSRVSGAILEKETRPPLHLSVVAIEKETFGLPKTTLGQPADLYIYIYIYTLCMCPRVLTNILYHEKLRYISFVHSYGWNVLCAYIERERERDRARKSERERD